MSNIDKADVVRDMWYCCCALATIGSKIYAIAKPITKENETPPKRKKNIHRTRQIVNQYTVIFCIYAPYVCLCSVSPILYQRMILWHTEYILQRMIDQYIALQTPSINCMHDALMFTNCAQTNTSCRNMFQRWLYVDSGIVEYMIIVIIDSIINNNSRTTMSTVMCLGIMFCVDRNVYKQSTNICSDMDVQRAAILCLSCSTACCVIQHTRVIHIIIISAQ